MVGVVLFFITIFKTFYHIKHQPYLFLREAATHGDGSLFVCFSIKYMLIFYIIMPPFLDIKGISFF